MRPAILLAAAAFAAAWTSAAASQCETTIGKTEFDLSALSQTYTFTGGDIPCTTTVEQNYSYFLSPCGSAISSRPSCTGRVGASTASVFQVDTTNPNNCYIAGQKQSPKYQLIDQNDAAVGIQVTFSGGDMCHTNQVARETLVRVFCDESATQPRSFSVSEPQGPKSCHYRLDMYAAAGCPSQCPRDDQGRVCSGKGLCLMDSNSPRCFCDDSQGGDKCDQPGSADQNGTGGASGGIIALLVVLFLLTVVFGVVLFLLVKQIRGYRDDTANYIEVSGGATEELNSGGSF